MLNQILVVMNQIKQLQNLTLEFILIIIQIRIIFQEAENISLYKENMYQKSTNKYVSNHIDINGLTIISTKYL